MRRLSTIYWLSLLLVGALWSCQKDKQEPLDISLDEPYQMSFEITDGHVTSTTYTFSVKPSDAEIPYLCLYVDKAVIDKVPKHDLPKFLMSELKKSAQAEGKTWEAFLSASAVKGEANKTIKGLLPGNLYELVVFGIKDNKLSQNSSFHFFETLKADPVDMTFDVEIKDATPTGATVNVVPSLKDVKWHFCCFSKSQYDRLKEAGMSDTQMASAFLSQAIRSYLYSVPEVTPEILQKFIDETLFEGDKSLKVGGPSFKGDTEYVHLTTAIFVTPDFEIVFISETSRGEFRTPKTPQRNTTFDIKVTNITQTHADVAVTPSDVSQPYIWRYGNYNEAIAKMTPEEHARYIVGDDPYISFEARAHGAVAYPRRRITPGQKHFLIAFGYQNGINTEVKRFDFEPLPPGNPEDLTVEIKIEEMTSDKIRLSSKPSDPSIYYLPLLYPDRENKESIKGRIIASIRRYIAMQSQGGFTSHANIFSALDRMACLGDEELTYSSVEAGGKYTLMVVAFDGKGEMLPGEKIFKPSFLTVPGYSTEMVNNPKILGVFDGTEENGQVFGRPDFVKDRAIMVVGYDVSQKIKEAYATTAIDVEDFNELDPTEYPDREILNAGNLNWTKMKLSVPRIFIVADWDKAQVSYSYGLSDKNERGPITRVALDPLKKADAKPIDELRRLVEEVNKAATSNARAFVRAVAPEWIVKERTNDVEQYMPERKIEQTQELRSSDTKPSQPQSKAKQGEPQIPLVRIA